MTSHDAHAHVPTLRYAAMAFIVHGVVVAMSLVSGLRSVPLEAGDAITYVMPARNIVEHGAFSREPVAPFVWEPYRTPGYPLVIAASIVVFGTHTAVVFFACLTAAAAAWCAVALAALFGASRSAQHAAGLVAALLPNSLGLSAMMLTDAMAGHLTLVWLYLLVRGCREDSMPVLGCSALVGMALQSLKPTYSIAALLVVVAVMLFYRGKRKRVTLAILVGLTLPVPLYLASRNHADHGVFATSLLGIETVREYLQVRHLQERSGEDHAALTMRVRAEDRRDAERRTQPASVYGRLYEVKAEKVRQFLREHPFAAMRLMVTEMVQQFAAPQEFFPKVFIGDLPTWGRGVGSLLTLALWLCAAIGGYTLWKAGNPAPALMIAAVLLFFLVTGSVSHYVGARLRFPADMSAAPLMGVGVIAGLNVCKPRYVAALFSPLLTHLLSAGL